MEVSDRECRSGKWCDAKRGGTSRGAEDGGERVCRKVRFESLGDEFIGDAMRGWALTTQNRLMAESRLHVKDIKTRFWSFDMHQEVYYAGKQRLMLSATSDPNLQSSESVV